MKYNTVTDDQLLAQAKSEILGSTYPLFHILSLVIAIAISVFGFITMNTPIMVIGVAGFVYSLYLNYTSIKNSPSEIRKRHNELRRMNGLPYDPV